MNTINTANKRKYPLRLSYLAKDAIWGGTRLKERYGKDNNSDRLAETWELSCRPGDVSVIENGVFSGCSLEDYIDRVGKTVIGKTYNGDVFPLLIKLIDAQDKLSVQVHPEDDYAIRNENDLGKTEMWHILEAKEGAKIIYGLAQGVSKEEFREAVRQDRYDSVLGMRRVAPGETYFIPAGMLHAIGEGIVVAEIQQNSNVTYRVYDYARRDKEGNYRPLHLMKAFDVVRPFSDEDIDACRYALAPETREENLLAACPYFTAYLHKIDKPKELVVGEESFLHLLCIAGGGSIVFE